MKIKSVSDVVIMSFVIVNTFNPKMDLEFYRLDYFYEKLKKDGGKR